MKKLTLLYLLLMCQNFQNQTKASNQNFQIILIRHINAKLEKVLGILKLC
jgi:hypothetical protein